MTPNRSADPTFFSPALFKKMLFGGGIALTLMMIFLAGAPEPEPEWGPYWTVRPLIVITLAGAAGGAFLHFVNPLRFHARWKKIAAAFICLFVYVFCLWIGTVLGLDGTLWN